MCRTKLSRTKLSRTKLCPTKLCVLSLTVLIGLLLTLAADAADKEDAKPKKQRQRPPASETADRAKPARTAAAERYVVVELDGEIVVHKKSELAARRKELDDAYRAKLKEYRAAKKEAKETGEKNETEVPPKPKIKQFGTSFKTEEQANAHREKVLKSKEGDEDKQDKPRRNSEKRRPDAAE